jgi:hypothetical protein
MENDNLFLEFRNTFQISKPVITIQRLYELKQNTDKLIADINILHQKILELENEIKSLNINMNDI